MKLKKEQRVSMQVACDRALTYLRSRPAGYLCRASEVAQAIWPDAEFKAQGAGAAASRVLKELEKGGFAKWTSMVGSTKDWGWRARRY